MRVALTKRLGQNIPGTVIDTTVTQARWMFERGVAAPVGERPSTAVLDSEPAPTRPATAVEDTEPQAKPKQGRRRTTKPATDTADDEHGA